MANDLKFIPTSTLGIDIDQEFLPDVVKDNCFVDEDGNLIQIPNNDKVDQTHQLEPES